MRCVQNRENLINLSLSGNVQFTEDDISVITRNMRLEKLDLGNISSVSDRNLEELSKVDNANKLINSTSHYYCQLSQDSIDNNNLNKAYKWFR